MKFERIEFPGYPQITVNKPLRLLTPLGFPPIAKAQLVSADGKVISEVILEDAR